MCNSDIFIPAETVLKNEKSKRVIERRMKAIETALAEMENFIQVRIAKISPNLFTFLENFALHFVHLYLSGIGCEDSRHR